VSNTYQKNRRRAQTDPAPVEVAVPEQVIVSMAEIAESAKEGLLALAVGTGMQVMAAMFAEDAGRLCGPGGKHNPGRAGYRHGSEAGPVTLGGRRIPVIRPRVRATDGSGELHLPSYDLFSSTEILGQLALERMLAGLSSRRYARGLEPAGQAVQGSAASTSKSAVSRRFAAATETALAELMSRRLDDLDLVAFMVDGVHFGEHTRAVALGIGIDGTKYPLAVEEGSTENATLVTGLITGLRERGLDVTKPVLAVLDGAKALSRAVKDVFDKPVIHRCQQHKIRNVIDKLPDKLRSVTEKRMRQAYHAESALKAEAELQALARELDKTHPGAAASLRGHDRDPHRAAPGRAAHAGANAPLHEHHRVNDRDLPGAQQERQALARRADGAALVCRRHARGRAPVPPRQRPPAPAEAARRTRRVIHRECRHQGPK
jgi:putative transposase